MKREHGALILSARGDSADAVAKEYTPETQGAFTGGEIQYVEVSVEEEQYRDLELEMAAAMSVD